MFIRSIAELRTHADRWDDLWLRSGTASPLVRAASIAQWLEHFAPTSAFSAVAIEDGDRLVAAIPLVQRRWLGVLPLNGFPTDPWSICGEMLIDPTCDPAVVVPQLLAAFNEHSCLLSVLQSTPLDAPHWKSFCQVARAAGWGISSYEDYHFDCLTVEGSWSDYLQTRSHAHRRHMQNALRRAEREGGVELRTHLNPPEDEIESLLASGFEIEDRSWKGVAGSSVLRSQGKFEFYCRQAKQMAKHGQLHLAFLQHTSGPIAFEYGYIAKGAYFSPKIGYDPAYRHLTPGQVLRWLMFKRFFDEQTVREVDFWGPRTEATSKWATHHYVRGRVILASPRIMGRTMLKAFDTARACKAGLREKLRRMSNPTSNLPSQPALGPSVEERTPLAV